ncbi:MAG: hypothetical protein J6C33_05565 [Lachnospiraceae bacterium]|nr:hypothetical protein [Lachnospiraceae bacterium]
MDINDRAINTIIKGIIDALEKRNALSAISVFPSVVYKANADHTYEIIKDKQKYNVKNGLGTTLTSGQSVWVMIPNENMKDMFICGVR